MVEGARQHQGVPGKTAKVPGMVTACTHSGRTVSIYTPLPTACAANPFRTIVSNEQAYDDAEFHKNFARPQTLSPSLEEQSTYNDRPGSSFSQPRSSRTIDSSATLIPHTHTPPTFHDKQFALFKSRSNGSYLEAGFGGLSMQKTPSQDTGRSSVSGSRGSGEGPQSNQQFPKRQSDASVDIRIRQMSFSSIRSEESPQRPSPENTTLQPLEIPQQRERHECPREVEAAFLQSFEAIGDEVLDESWIRIATWWLLKVCGIHQVLTTWLIFLVANCFSTLGHCFARPVHE